MTTLTVGLFAQVQEEEVSRRRTIQQSAWKEKYKNTFEIISAATRFVDFVLFRRIYDRKKGEKSSENTLSVNK